MGFLRKLVTRAQENSGQGLAEYAMILALVAVVAVAALTPLGTTIKTTLDTITAAL